MQPGSPEQDGGEQDTTLPLQNQARQAAEPLRWPWDRLGWKGPPGASPVPHPNTQSFLGALLRYSHPMALISHRHLALRL